MNNMVKRRAVVQSDDEKQLPTSSPASKRARTDNSNDEPPSTFTPERKHSTKGKGKARRIGDNDEEDEEANAPTFKEEDDEQFEEKHESNIRAAIEAKHKVHGGIADHGIIESIEMHQFMCHKYLTFTFGPQINFIIGHNGSGKSAVLSAITVALGGKATSTGRGNGLKFFIREGESTAEVTISLKNQGEEAFKPKEYGKSIVITRRFTKEGSSSWKIKSKDGKIISTKKDELAAICDHMNIQVDNPMNVLTQDAARQFLSASHPTDKYKFFLRGTQLSQLNDEYDICYDNIEQTQKLLVQKKDALPDLQNSFKDATRRFEEASKAREQKKKADELKKELAWAHVATKENEMKKKIEDAAKMARRLPKIQESLDEAKAKFDDATKQVAIFEAEHSDLGDIEHLQAQKKTLQDKIRVNKDKLSDFMRLQKQMDTSMRGTNTQIEECDRRIAEEARRMETHTQAKREETNQKLEKARLDVEAAEANLKALEDQKRAKQADCDAAIAEGRVVEAAQKAVKQKINEFMTMIEQCQQQERNSLNPYGKDIKVLLDQISKTQWHGDMPLGPLGLHVNVKDPKMWADVLRAQLSQYLTAFAVTDVRDRRKLKDMLVKSGNGNLLIIIYEKDLFDYSRGEPDPSLLTVLRALDIGDPHVERILINQAHIEKVFLSPTRRESEGVLAAARGGSAWTKDGFRVMSYSEGGGSSTRLQLLNRDDKRNLLFSGGNATGRLQEYRSELAKAETEYNLSSQKVEGLRTQHNACRGAIDGLDGQLKHAYARCCQAKATLNALQQDANDELPAGIADLEAAKQEAVDEKESIRVQFADLMRQKAEVDEAQRPLLLEQDGIKKRIEEFAELQRAVRVKVEDAGEDRLVAQNSLEHYKKKLKEEQTKVDEAEEIAKVLQEEFQNWTAKAREYCDPVENPRKVEEVQRNLDSVQAALKEREKRHGASVEDMTVEVNKAKANLDNADRDFRHMTALNKALKKSLIIRLAKWQEFRRHIALRCKLVFQFHLSNRGYYGKVLFDHANATLQLKVQTDDQSAREKDPRSLSGGEKSFSTICLLLSLWESIGCPLRCLDEFDVFMDAVNRRISMKMMIDTANASDKKQYILITPQDMNNVVIGTTVRVHRMTDPERNQGVLAFS